MVNLKREGLSLLLKWGRAILKSEDSSQEAQEAETTETPEPSVDDSIAGPMKAYWETDKKTLSNNNQESIDFFLNGKALERIPDTTEEPVKESHYKYAKFNLFHLPEALKNDIDATQTPKPGTGISSSGRDAGVVAGIVVAVISGVLILAALIAVVLYKHYVHRNVTSMNFDNPVYRKTTEDQFALEKNGYAPGSKLYPSTVGEEAREPLNTPGTNEYV